MKKYKASKQLLAKRRKKNKELCLTIQDAKELCRRCVIHKFPKWYNEHVIRGALQGLYSCVGLINFDCVTPYELGRLRKRALELYKDLSIFANTGKINKSLYPSWP